MDLRNTARPDRDFPVRLTAEPQPGAGPVEVTTARAWVSYDHGVTWTEVPTSSPGDGWVAHVDNSAARGGGYVSLRVDLSAADGTAVTRTLIDAYGVR